MTKTNENTRSALLNTSAGYVAAGHGLMLQATIGFSLYFAHVNLPKGSDGHLTAKEADETVKVALESQSDGTAGAVKNVSKKLAIYLCEKFGKPGKTAEGTPHFWDVLTIDSVEQAIALTSAALKAEGWDGSWRGLKSLVGIKGAKPKAEKTDDKEESDTPANEAGDKPEPMTAKEVFSNAIKAAVKDYQEGNLAASDISQAIVTLNSLLHAPASSEIQAAA